MRCSRCGHELGAKSPRPGEVQACPRCGSGVPAVGVEPLPPVAGQSVIPAWFGRALNVGCGTIVLGVIAAWALTIVSEFGQREAANRMSCSNNLKQIAIALHNYHETYKALPAQSVTDEDGRPIHSWRVAILPFMEQQELFARYDFSQPWDSETNRDVRLSVVPGYLCPSGRRSDEFENRTTYFVVYGDETMFAPNEWRTFSDATDGLANTILVVECDSPEFRVEWSEPRDIPFGLMSFRIDPPEGQGLGSEHHDGINVAFGDGHVRFLKSEEIDEATFRYLLIRNDGEEVPLP